APEVDVSAPPDIVSPAFAVSAFVPLARVPPERASRPAIVSWLWSVRVPPLTVSAPKDALPPIRRFPVPENVTDELVAVKVVADGECAEMRVDRRDRDGGTVGREGPSRIHNERDRVDGEVRTARVQGRRSGSACDCKRPADAQAVRGHRERDGRRAGVERDVSA